MDYSSWDNEQNILKLVILGHFCPFTSLKNPKIKILKNKKNGWRYHLFRHDVWFLRSKWDRHNFLSFWVFFYPSSPPHNQESQNFEKLKKPPADIIILHICTINNNHMMYGSWDIERDRQNFFILDHLLPFYPNPHLWTQKIKVLKKWKKHLKISSFYKSVH